MEKLKALKSVKMTGKMSMGQGVEAPFIMQMKRPNKLRIEFIIQGLTGIQAYDGTSGWTLMPFMGSKDPQKSPEEDTKDLAEQADFDGPLVDYKDKGHTIEYIGKEDVEGTQAEKLKITLKSGKVRYIYMDPEWGLDLKVTAIVKREGIEASVDTLFGDYKEVGGLTFPHALEQKMAGRPGQQSFTIEKIELDTEMDDAIFVMPEVSPQTQSQPSQQE